MCFDIDNDLSVFMPGKKDDCISPQKSAKALFVTVFWFNLMQVKLCKGHSKYR